MPTVWCIGPAKFVKEIAPLIEEFARVRWIADAAALSRNLASGQCSTAIFEHSAEAPVLLRLMQQFAPRSRRLVVMGNHDLKAVRTYLDDGIATELVYRPLERAVMLRACGLLPANHGQGAVARVIRSRSASHSGTSDGISI